MPVHILAFPCDQFFLQEPAANDEIINGIMYVRPGNGFIPHKKIHFFEKSQVNGANETALYTNLKVIADYFIQAGYSTSDFLYQECVNWSKFWILLLTL